MKKIFKNNIFITLIFCLTASFAFFLVGCGSTPDNSTIDNNKQFSYATCEIKTGENYTVTNAGEIEIDKDINIREILSSEDFTVTLHYTNGETEIASSGYVINVYDENGGYYKYRIEIKYQNDLINTIFAKVRTETLPNLTNISKMNGEYSGYVFDEELRYTGNEYNILERIATTANNLTLADLVSQNKVEIDISGEGAYRATNPNVVYGDDYGSYYFTANAKEGYKWVINDEDVTTIGINWSIKRQIIETPVLTSGTEFTFQHEWNETEEQYVPIPQGLTFNYGNGEQFITKAEKHGDASEYYETVITISENYQAFYAFLVNGQERTYTEPYNWSISKLKVEMPTIVGGTLIEDPETGISYPHFVYTGNDIKPELASDVLKLFKIDYPSDCENAGDYYRSINVTLTDEYYATYNYNFVSGPINYYIDKAEFPEDVKNEIENISFTLEKNYVAENTYQEYVSSLAAYDFINSEEDIQKTGYNDYSSLIFKIVSDGPEASEVLNSGDYSVLVEYSIDSNHKSIEFMATLRISPIGYELSGNFELWVTSPGRSGEIGFNNALIYNSEATYSCYLRSSNDSVSITYVITYGTEEENLENIIEEIKDAGYYEVVANINTIYNDPTNYYVYLADDADKTPITSLRCPNIIHIEKQMVYAYPTFSGNLESYYVENASRNIQAEFTGYNEEEMNEKINVDEMTSLTYYRASKNGEWVEAQNTYNAGYYKTVFNYELNDEYQTNYQLYNHGVAEKEWVIYTNVYNLQTTNSSNANFVGWLDTDFVTYKYAETDDEMRKHFTAPEGIDYYFCYDVNPIKDGENWIHSGSSQTWAYSFVLGDRLVWASLYIDLSLVGYDNVTIYVNNNLCVENGYRVYDTDNKVILTSDLQSRNNDYYSNSDEFAHFENKEPTPTNYTIGNNQTFSLEGYKYFSFITDSTHTKYILITNTSSSFMIRDNESIEYSNLPNDAMLDYNHYYYIFELDLNTTYVLQINDYGATQTNENAYFIITVYHDQLNFEYEENIERKPYTPGDPIEFVNGFAVSAKGTSVGETITVPLSIYAQVGEVSGSYDVYAIAENGFENNEITTIYLSSNIINIGSEAFKNCVNLTDIYYDSLYGNWNELMIFGENCFEGCSNLVLHTNDGKQFRLNSSGMIGEEIITE